MSGERFVRSSSTPCPPSSFYNAFGNKEALYQELVAFYFGGDFELNLGATVVNLRHA